MRSMVLLLPLFLMVGCTVADMQEYVHNLPKGYASMPERATSSPPTDAPRQDDRAAASTAATLQIEQSVQADTLYPDFLPLEVPAAPEELQHTAPAMVPVVSEPPMIEADSYTPLARTSRVDALNPAVSAPAQQPYEPIYIRRQKAPGFDRVINNARFND